MILASLSLFELFRWLLAIVCTVYAIIVTGQWLYSWLQYFGLSRQTALLGRYATVLLVRIRLRRFVLELLQIGTLIALFFYIVHLHRVTITH